FANEQNWQPLQCRKVYAFVKGAFLGRAVAEKCRDDPVLTASSDSKGVTDCDRYRGSHHGRSAKHIMGRVDQMHRTARASGASSKLAVKLGHQGIHVPTFGEIDRVSAIGSRDDIIGSQNVANTDCNCLLADGKVYRAFYVVTRIYASDLLLNVPDVPQAAINS